MIVMRQKPKSRRLKHNRTTRYPQYFCFVDTETLLEKRNNERTYHNLRLGVSILLRLRKDGCKNTKTVLQFTNPSQFWSEVLQFISGKNTLHIVAHNALFDMTVLQHQKHLTENGFNCDFVFEDGVTFISKWSNGDKRVMILDNANWFKGKLEKWGDKLGLPKMEMPEFEADDQTWFTYCERDTEILYRLQLWLIEFLVDNDLGNWRFTLASCSFNSYRHRFMYHPIYIPEKSRETYLARKSYRGGRTECFYQGEYDNGPYYKLDINSNYAAIMRNNTFPVAVDGYTQKPSETAINHYLNNGGIIADVTITPRLPFYPINHKFKTCYPVGEFRTILTTGELKLAFENDWIVQLHECALYRMRPIFKEFVDFFYGERLRWQKRGDELRSYFFKIFLNALYGKFGQRHYEDKVIGQAEPGSWETSYHYDSITREHAIIRQMGRNIIKSSKKGEGYNAFVAVASHVTAYARIHLYRLVIKASRKNVYYCDTDSLIVNQQGYDNLNKEINPNRLGKLKVEGTSDRVILNAPKHYYFDNKWTIKGIRKNATRTEDGGYNQEVWPGLNTILKDEKEEYFNYYITKYLRATVQSGEIMPNGQVMPFIIGKDG